MTGDPIVVDETVTRTAGGNYRLDWTYGERAAFSLVEVLDGEEHRTLAWYALQNLLADVDRVGRQVQWRSVRCGADVFSVGAAGDVGPPAGGAADVVDFDWRPGDGRGT